MKKENFMAMAHTKDDKIWIAYLLDRISFAEEKYVSSYTAFLDIREQAIAKRILASFAHLPHLFWGGSPDCERAQLGIAGEYGQILPEDFPLVSFKLTSR